MTNQTNLANADIYDLTVLLFALDVLSVELVSLELEVKELLAKAKHSESVRLSDIRCRQRKKENGNKYPTWSSIENDIPDNIFRRKFRMTKPTFRKLLSNRQTKC